MLCKTLSTVNESANRKRKKLQAIEKKTGTEALQFEMKID